MNDLLLLVATILKLEFSFATHVEVKRKIASLFMHILVIQDYASNWLLCI